ncbi:DUF669 domain-containing protein [Psychrobacillus sp. Sa2BUA9]|uniref:DUF669 domain-containing protein n=1 Tax=Psychrobacillus faecigallinarum TaxID=2762235 RepID=A0ABR8R4A7_9BACI|nr:DUF669 domain-containing protein [Psychrobacillus faecigallinarum]MBD7942507.1 DUF669 domain-containing protein [Psychrobacillus faecigallinarum]
MSFFKMDEVEEVKGFSPIEKGEYEVTVLNAIGSVAKSSGKPKLEVDFEIRSDVPQNHQGAKIQYNTFTFEHPTAKGIAKSFFKACGMPDNYAPASVEQMAKDVIGKTLVIYVTQKKQDDGREFPKASSYKASNVNPPQQTHAPVTVGDDQLPF